MKGSISKQSAIEAVDEGLTRVFVEPRDIAEKMINKISSAPQRTGRWVKVNGKTAINCSACYHCSWSRSFEDTVKRFNFCPNCGARMEGE